MRKIANQLQNCIYRNLKPTQVAKFDLQMFSKVFMTELLLHLSSKILMKKMSLRVIWSGLRKGSYGEVPLWSEIFQVIKICRSDSTEILADVEKCFQCYHLITWYTGMKSESSRGDSMMAIVLLWICLSPDLRWLLPFLPEIYSLKKWKKENRDEIKTVIDNHSHSLLIPRPHLTPIKFRFHRFRFFTNDEIAWNLYNLFHVITNQYHCLTIFSF